MARTIGEYGMKGQVGRLTGEIEIASQNCRMQTASLKGFKHFCPKGLDPAKPAFDFGGHLTRTDAKLVDVIHTQCGNLIEVHIYIISFVFFSLKKARMTIQKDGLIL